MSISRLRPLGAHENSSGDVFLLELGQAVMRRRQALGLSLAQLSERTGIEAEQLEQLERGQWDIDVVMLRCLASSLATNANDVLADVERILMMAVN